MKNYQSIFEEALQAGESRNYKKAALLLSGIISETDEFPQALLYLGRSLHSLENYAEAITILKHFINQKPELGAGYFFLGRTYLAVDKPELAVYYLRKAKLKENENSHIESLLGTAFLRLKKPDSAVACLEKAVNLDPKNKAIYTAYCNALYVKGIKCFRNGDIDIAGQIFNFLIENGHETPGIHIYCAISERITGNFEKALYHYEKALEGSPSDPALKIGRIFLLFQLGQKEDALKELDGIRKEHPEIKSFNPENSDYFRYMTILNFHNENYKQVIVFGRIVLKKEPDDFTIRLYLGEAHRKCNDLNRAKNFFQTALMYNKSSLEAHLGLALVFWEQGYYQNVLNEMARIELLDAENDFVSYYRALCYAKIDSSKETTIQLLQDAIKNYGPDPFLMNALGFVYLQNNKEEYAEKWFLKSLKIAGENVDSRKGLLELYKIIDDNDKSEKAYEAYLKLAPEDNNIRKEYIRSLISKGKFSTAEKEILKHEASEDDKSFQGLLALCFLKNGKYIEGAVIYRQLLRRQPENVDYIRGLIFCYDKSGNTKNAVFFLEKALSFIKPKLSLLLILGVLKYKDGDSEGALKTFRNALAVSKGDWRAYQNIGIIYKKKGIDSFAEMFFSRAEEYKNKDKV